VCEWGVGGEGFGGEVKKPPPPKAK